MIELWTPDIIKINEALGGRMRLVGGCVRDFLRGVEPRDRDIATPVPPDQVVALLGEAGIRAVITSAKHGVLTAHIGDNTYEIVTLREDVETDGSHAVVRYTEDYAVDARRRDFTINAMSMDAAGNIYDYFGGIADLKKGLIRFIGNPATRIEEDFIRIYRYFRFWALLGRGEPDTDVMLLCHQGRYGLGQVSKERRKKEFLKILMTPQVIPALEHMHRMDVLKYVLRPADIPGLKTFLEICPDATVWERLVILADGQDLSHLNLDNRQSELVERLSATVPFRDERALKLIRGYQGEAVFRFLLARGLAQKAISAEEYGRLMNLKVPEIPVKLSDIEKMPGMKKSRKRQEAIQMLCRIWLDLDFPADKEVLMQHFINYMKSIGRM